MNLLMLPPFGGKDRRGRVARPAAWLAGAARPRRGGGYPARQGIPVPAGPGPRHARREGCGAGSSIGSVNRRRAHERVEVGRRRVARHLAARAENETPAGPGLRDTAPVSYTHL